MRKLFLLVLFTLFITPATAAYTIDADGGGNIVQYANRYADLQRRGVKIVIRGGCYSACTMALGYGACVYPKAILGFHPAYWPLGIKYIISKSGTRFMASHYPPDILRMVNRRGGLTDKGGWRYPAITSFRGSELPAKYRCSV